MDTHLTPYQRRPGTHRRLLARPAPPSLLSAVLFLLGGQGLAGLRARLAHLPLSAEQVEERRLGCWEAGKVVLNKTSCFSGLLPPHHSHPPNARQETACSQGSPRFPPGPMGASAQPGLQPQGGAGPLGLINSLSPLQNGSLSSCQPHRARGPRAQPAQSCLWVRPPWQRCG